MMHIKHAVPTWRIYIFMVVSKPLLTASAAAIQTIQDVMQPVTASLSKYIFFFCGSKILQYRFSCVGI